MRFILKSAHMPDIEKAARFGFIDGIMLPRAEVERTGRDYDSLLRSVLQHPFAVIGSELKELSFSGIKTEIMDYKELQDDRILAFLPMTLESLKAFRGVEAAPLRLGIQYAATLVQWLAAARSGAQVLLLQAKQLDRFGLSVPDALASLARALYRARLECEIWVESGGGVAETSRLVAAGIDGLVFTWDMLEELFYHPVADRLLERRLTPWTHTPSE